MEAPKCKAPTTIVTARFIRAVHVFAVRLKEKDVDGPDKPGHDVFF